MTLPDQEGTVVLARLWACHGCKMIGTKAEARAHSMVTDHEPVELTQEESDGVRALWWEDRAKRAAGFMLAKRNRGPFADAWRQAASDGDRA